MNSKGKANVTKSPLTIKTNGLFEPIQFKKATRP